MTDYSNPSTPLTAREYAWSATLTCGPAQYGSSVPAKDRTGSYSPPPGATVGRLREGVVDMHARECGIPATDVVVVRFGLREK